MDKGIVVITVRLKRKGVDATRQRFLWQARTQNDLRKYYEECIRDGRVFDAECCNA